MVNHVRGCREPQGAAGLDGRHRGEEQVFVGREERELSLSSGLGEELGSFARDIEEHRVVDFVLADEGDDGLVVERDARARLGRALRSGQIAVWSNGVAEPQ